MASLETVLLYAIISAMAVMLLMWKTGPTVFRKLLGFEVLIDAAFTIHMFAMFGLTFSGLVTAIVGGFAFSLMLRAAKNWWGYETLGWQQKRIIWQAHNARWR